MSTSTNRASAFDTYHPVVTLLDTELALGPPLLSRHQFTNTHPHFDKDYFDCPPAYHPSSRYPRVEFSRVDVDAPPYECMFVKPTKVLDNKIKPYIKLMIGDLRTKLREIHRGARYLFASTYEDLTSWNEEENWTPGDIATALLDASSAAASIATEYQSWMEGDNIFNRWKLMFMDVFIKLFTGLEILGMSIANEVDGEWRYMDNRVCIWLSDILVGILSPRVSNLESCASRWIENVHLWSTRNYPPHMYLGLLGRLPRAIVDHSFCIVSRPQSTLMDEFLWIWIACP